MEINDLNILKIPFLVSNDFDITKNLVYRGHLGERWQCSLLRDNVTGLTRELLERNSER